MACAASAVSAAFAAAAPAPAGALPLASSASHLPVSSHSFITDRLPLPTPGEAGTNGVGYRW